MSDRTTIRVILPRDLWWTSNDLRGSHHRWDAKIRAVRLLGKSAAIAQRARKHQVIELTVWVGYPTNTRADPDNIAGTVAKHARDGFIDAGILPDDDSRHVIATTYRREPDKAPRGTHTLRFELTEVTP